jgi:hypothetical protein
MIQTSKYSQFHLGFLLILVFFFAASPFVADYGNPKDEEFQGPIDDGSLLCDHLFRFWLMSTCVTICRRAWQKPPDILIQSPSGPFPAPAV